MPTILESGLAQIKKDLEALPPDTKGAFVATVNTHGVITVGIATKLDNGWSVSAQIEGKLKKTMPDGYIGVTKTW